MILGAYRRLDVRPLSPNHWAKIQERKEEIMRLEKDEQNKIVVSVATVSRDKDGETVRKTIKSFNVYEATPAEAVEAVVRGLTTRK